MIRRKKMVIFPLRICINRYPPPINSRSKQKTHRKSRRTSPETKNTTFLLSSSRCRYRAVLLLLLVVVVVFSTPPANSFLLPPNFLDVIEFRQRSAAAEGSAFVPPMPTAQSLAASERGRCARAATHDLGVHPSFRGCFPQSLFLFSSSMQRRRW